MGRKATRQERKKCWCFDREEGGGRVKSGQEAELRRGSEEKRQKEIDWNWIRWGERREDTGRAHPRGTCTKACPEP